MSRDASEAELVRASQAGHEESLAALLEHHRAGMLATAITILGYRADVHDAVQEAMLVALRRIGELKHPDAAGSWLRAIVRNVCLMHLRSIRHELPLEPVHANIKSQAAAADAALEHHALREWTWTALDRLSAPLQLVVLLRYFSGVSSYETIAALCEIPIGTVRSRLNDARQKLTALLTEPAMAGASSDVVARNAAHQRVAAHLLAASQRGEFRRALSATTHAGMSLIGPAGQRARGRDFLARMMDSDLDAGVRQRILNIAASPRFVTMECELLSPPSDPDHCPPQVAWLMSFRDHRIDRIRLFHPARA